MKTWFVLIVIFGFLHQDIGAEKQRKAIAVKKPTAMPEASVGLPAFRGTKDQVREAIAERRKNIERYLSEKIEIQEKYNKGLETQAKIFEEKGHGKEAFLEIASMGKEAKDEKQRLLDEKISMEMKTLLHLEDLEKKTAQEGKKGFADVHREWGDRLKRFKDQISKKLSPSALKGETKKFTKFVRDMARKVRSSLLGAISAEDAKAYKMQIQETKDLVAQLPADETTAALQAVLADAGQI